MNTQALNLIVNFGSDTLAKARSGSLAWATCVVFKALPEPTKERLLKSDSESITVFNAVMSYIRPEANKNSIDRLRRFVAESARNEVLCLVERSAREEPAA